jgi:hypothetical protein
LGPVYRTARAARGIVHGTGRGLVYRTASRGPVYRTAKSFGREIENQAVFGWPGPDALPDDFDDSVLNNSSKRVNDIGSRCASGDF